VLRQLKLISTDNAVSDTTRQTLVFRREHNIAKEAIESST
jgi:hypothetical protein